MCWRGNGRSTQRDGLHVATTQPGGVPHVRAKITVSGGRMRRSIPVPNFASAEGGNLETRTSQFGLGALISPPMRMARIRSLPIVFRLNGTAVPSIDAETVRLANAASAIALDRQAA